MNKQVYRQDIIAAVIVILVGAAAFILALDMPGNAPMFPKLVSAVLVILGILMIVDSLIKIHRDVPAGETPVKLGGFKSPVIVLFMLILYVLAVIYIGFYISTPVMLVCYMYVMGIRKPKTILTATLAVMAFV